MKKYARKWHTGPKVKVSIADGKMYESNQYCKLFVRVVTGNGMKNLIIDDVLYIPDLCNMMLSDSKMCQKGFRVDFNENTCTIRGPSNTHMVITKEVNKNLFRIPMFPPISQNGDDVSKHAYLPNMEGTPKIMSMKMMSENIRIWHNALGHPGATLMKKLTKNGKIP